MIKKSQVEFQLTLIMLFGIWISIALVFFGGIFFLYQHGSEQFKIETLTADIFKLTPSLIVKHALSFTSLGIIELGLFVLVLTQILRVILLTSFYMMSRDQWFSIFSLFILLVLMFSFKWQD